MRILVCVKQVPRLDEVRFDRANRIVREDVPSVCNPLDTRALGSALNLRGETDEVVAITMGPPAARSVLEEAVHSGADRAIHLTDRRFKGADTLATARALAEIVRREEPEVVLFGRGTLDGATAQLGQQVAELADMHQITEAVDVQAGEDVLLVERETELGSQVWRVPLPVAVTVARGPLPPEPAKNTTMDTTEEPDLNIVEVTADDLGGKPIEYGTRGSPTFVKEVRVRAAEPRGERVESEKEAVDRVLELFSGIGGDEPVSWNAVSDVEEEVWVLADRHGDALDQITFESLACGRNIAAHLNGRVTAVLLADEDNGSSTGLAAHGADRVLHVRHPNLRDYGMGAYVSALSAVLDRERPFVLIAPWTATGRDYVPRVAARHGLGLTGDVTGVEVESGDKPRLLWVKPAWAGTAEALVVSRTTPTVATLRPGSYRPLARRDVSAEVETFDVELAPEAGGARLVSSRQDVEDCLLDRARFVFCLGGEVSEASAARVIELAAKWNAGVGGTREAVSRGLVPAQWELGILKRSIAPEVCVVLGARQAQEVSPVRGASEVITVHPDADVSAHEPADLRVVAEVESLVGTLADRSAQ